MYFPCFGLCLKGPSKILKGKVLKPTAILILNFELSDPERKSALGVEVKATYFQGHL